MTRRNLQRSYSAPALSSLGYQHCVVTSEAPELEVYIGSRQFREHGGFLTKTLSDDVKEYAKLCGICHFFLIFKTQDGKMFQYDFGPAGGDIHVQAYHPFSFRFQRNEQQKQATKKDDEGVPGEIREEIVMNLPDDYLYIGSTSLTIDDIRKFNYLQSTYYLLHKNDCRHYANKLAQHATGIEQVSSFYVKRRLSMMKDSLSIWNSSFIWMMQGLTNVSHWPKIKAAGNATAAALVALAGPYFAQGVRLPPPVRVHPVRRAAVAAIATAAATCEEVPVLRNVVRISHRLNKGAQTLFIGVNRFFHTARKTTVSLQRQPLHCMAAHSVTRFPQQRSAFSFIRQASGNSLSYLTTTVRRPFCRTTNIGSITMSPIWRPFRLTTRSRRRFQLSLPYSI